MGLEVLEAMKSQEQDIAESNNSKAAGNEVDAEMLK